MQESQACYDGRPLLTIRQAAEKLQMTTVSLYKLIRTGDLRAVRIPQRNKDGKITRHTIRFTDSLLEDFIKANGGL